MLLNSAAGLAAAFLLSLPAVGPGDQVPTARRVAATAELAAQEYRAGVRHGRVVAPAEVEEATLFLTEARRSAALLPALVSSGALQSLDSIIDLVHHAAEPDTVASRVRGLTAWLAARLGVALDDIPATAPALARGQAVYRANCAGCHGDRGFGDGPTGRSLHPPPANLADEGVLAGRSPLDFYHRITIGVAGTAMPSFETELSPEDRWAAAVYATLLRLPAPRGSVPPPLADFGATARLSDSALLALPAADSVAPAERLAWVSAVRRAAAEPGGAARARVFARVREQLDSAFALVSAGNGAAASTEAFDAYMTFEQVERDVRTRNAALADRLEAAFAALRTRAAGGATVGELTALRSELAAGLENAERVVADRLSPLNLFLQSFILLLREGLEAILIVGALLTFLVKTGAGSRRRDIHIGVAAAVGASLLTAVVLETLFELTPGRREALEGGTMVVATGVLFYVSYWLLSKMEVVKWTNFVKSRVQDAVTSGSALALASAAFLAVYREGFETVLFYKALFVSGGVGNTTMPVVAGMLVGGVALAAVYVAINRFGVRLPLKPFFGVTSAFLYYMAFVFAGKGVAELQEGGLVSTTPIPALESFRIPSLGIFPTVETLAAQAVLVALFLVALAWIFVLEPRRARRRAAVTAPPPGAPVPAGWSAPGAVAPGRELLRSLERMDADLAELRAEVERMRDQVQGEASAPAEEEDPAR